MIVLENNTSNPFWKITYLKAKIEKTASPVAFGLKYFVSFPNDFDSNYKPISYDLYLYNVIGLLEADGLMFSFKWGRNKIREITLIKIYPSK